MTGPEHYAEAERLLEFADSPAGRCVDDIGDEIAKAHVHATLALAAATAQTRSTTPPEAWGGTTLFLSDSEEWGKVIG